MEKFENEVKIITYMKEKRPADALKLITELRIECQRVEEEFKLQALETECLLSLRRYDDAKLGAAELIQICVKKLNLSEVEISCIALHSREKGEYIRAMLFYLCSLHCWVRDMRADKVRKRTIEVITRGEKYALSLQHIGSDVDSHEIMTEFGVPCLQEVMQKYEIGPPNLESHRDLSIMGCYYHIGLACKKLGDLNLCLQLTKEGINTGMKSMKEHKNYLLPKAHNLVAETYLELKDYENAGRWFESALGLCPFIVNWDFQSPTERKKEFEKQINDSLKLLKSKPIA